MTQRVECLDGLRGVAALWVFMGHCMYATGFLVPILQGTDLAVDLFIYLSGFLMVFQYNLRKKREDWSRLGTWTSFWVRRFFRLSPLYFLLLVVALFAGELIFADRQVIGTFLNVEHQLSHRYLDTSVTNFLAHVTYVFGLLPNYAYRTPLPDWSLGLEMQFYAIFPFAVLFARKAGWLIAASTIAVITVLFAIILLKLDIHFPLPSLIVLKMHMFLAGMLTAAAMEKANKLPYLALAMVMAAIPIGGGQGVLRFVVREALLLVLFGLVHWRAVVPIAAASRLLGSRPFYWLGELSYAVYLVHLLVIYAIAAWVIRQWGHDIIPAVRFAIVFGSAVPLVYGLAFVAYRFVEKPGQDVGRALLPKSRKPALARQTVAEKIAAP